MKISKLRKWISVLLCIAVIFSLAACGNTGETSDSSTDKESAADANDSEPIKIAVSAWNPNVFMYLAQDLGYFDDAGVNVDLIDFAEFSDVPKAFNAGQLDGAFFSSFEVIAPASLGVDIKLVSVVDNSVGADGLLGYDVTSIEDLKGKKIGVGMDTVSHIFLMLLLEEEGYSLDDFELVDFSSPSNGATALLTGDIQGLATFEPFISSCQSSDDKVHVIADTSQYPTMINDGIAFSGSVLENRHDEVVKIMECFYKAIDYWKENPDEANETLGGYLDCSGEDFAATMQKLDMVSAEDSYAQMTEEGEGSWAENMNLMSKFLLDRGRITNDIDVSKYIDTSVLADIVGK